MFDNILGFTTSYISWFGYVIFPPCFHLVSFHYCTTCVVILCIINEVPFSLWQVLESLNLCMVVGLAVDYVVHLAEAYNASKCFRRQEKTRNMLEKIGLSVISGAFTTFGAAVFMLGAQIQFIYQFGIFVMITVSASVLFSMFAFTSLMFVMGPEGETGSLIALAKKCCLCCKEASKRTDDKIQKDVA